MDYKEAKSLVDSLTNQASNATDSMDALKFSQAALNVANAYCSLAAVRNPH